MRMDEHIKRLIEKYTLEASRVSGEEALEKYEMAYTQAKELGSAFTRRACAANLGAAYISLGKKKEAQEGLEYLKEATPPEGVSDCVSNGDLYFNMGLGYEIVGEYEKAYLFLERAWKDYRSERDNLAMEISALKKLVQVSKVRKRYEEAIKWCHQLEESYGQAQRPINKMMIMQERAFLQKNLGTEDFDEAVEQCQHHVDQIRQQGNATVEILVHMSVMLTHRKNPDAAHHYLQEANSLLGVEHSMTLNKAVVLQNLGMLCNYLGHWQASLPYHRDAVIIYQHLASLPPDPASPISPLVALKCQGHCYANHGYALAMMDDEDEARILFNKAREVATQSGDLDTRWQMEEALGAVHFRMACHDLSLHDLRDASLKVRQSPSRMMQLKKSLEWYKLALLHLNSTLKGATEVQDRVLEKYTLVKNFKDNAYEGPPGEPPFVRAAGNGPCAESGLQFPDGVVNGTMDENQEEAEVEAEGEESDGEETDEEDSGDDSSDVEETEGGSPVGQTMHSPGEDEDDQTQMKALYQAQLSGNDGTLQSSAQQQTVQADVHRRRVSSSAESGSTDTSDDESTYDEEEEEEEEEERRKRRQAPPLPTQSPPVTMKASGTYENPQTPAETEINELYGASPSRPRPGVQQGTSNYAELDLDSTQPRSAGADRENDDNPDYETVEAKPTPKPWRSTHRSKQQEGPVNFEVGGSSVRKGQGKQTKESKTCVVM